MQYRLRSRYQILLALLFATASTSSGHAQGINGRATGLTGAFATYGFDGLGFAIGTAVTNQLAASNLLFEGAYYGPLSLEYGPFGSAAIYNYNGQDASNAIVIEFAQAVSSVAFNFATTPGTSSFEAFKNGKSVVKTMIGSNPEFTSENIAKWWGFEYFDGTQFDRLVITSAPEPSASFAFGIDNLQVGNATVVPEPSTVALLAAGLGLLFVALRRRGSV